MYCSYFSPSEQRQAPSLRKNIAAEWVKKIKASPVCLQNCSEAFLLDFMIWWIEQVDMVKDTYLYHGIDIISIAINKNPLLLDKLTKDHRSKLLKHYESRYDTLFNLTSSSLKEEQAKGEAWATIILKYFSECLATINKKVLWKWLCVGKVLLYPRKDKNTNAGNVLILLHQFFIDEVEQPYDPVATNMMAEIADLCFKLNDHYLDQLTDKQLLALLKILTKASFESHPIWLCCMNRLYECTCSRQS